MVEPRYANLMMRKCPQCGYEQPIPPYEYHGWLEPYLPTILRALRMGHSPRETFKILYSVHPDVVGGTSVEATVATISNIRKRYEIEAKQTDFGERDRNRKIVERYQAGGITLRKLAAEFELSCERVRQIIAVAERRERVQEELSRAMEGVERIEDVPIDALDLPVRAKNCFSWAGGQRIETVGEAMKLSDSDLLRIDNFGRGSLNDWKRCLAELQRHFAAKSAKSEETP